jgi:hypothetical protein
MCDGDDNVYVRQAGFEEGREQILDEVKQIFDTFDALDLQYGIEQFLAQNGVL